MAKLVLIRHGESMWNQKNVFTGWVDVPLSNKGIEEALTAGEKIADIDFDIIFTSTLLRAQMTTSIAMLKLASGKTPVMMHKEGGRLTDWAKIYDPTLAQATIPVYADWHLNERYYGELQGLNKAATMEKFGTEQVKLWRRSYDVPPPNGESLKDTAARTIPFFLSDIMPCVVAGKNVLIVAHGNSLRSIIMHINKLSESEVIGLELATGEPIFFTFQDGKLLPA